MKLKAAIIGLGRMGAEPTSRFNGMLCKGWDPISHAESIVSSEHLQLVALCDIDTEKTRRFSELYHVENTFNDYKKLIDTIKPDVISIATRTNMKQEIIEYALENGVKGFYVEKPLSRSVGDCTELLNKIKTADAKIAYGAQRRALAIMRKAKEICVSGEYGTIKTLTFEYGRNMLLWSHPHTTDLMVYFANSVDLDFVTALCTFDKVYAANEMFIDNDPVVETAFVKFKNGVAATITPNDGNNIRIHLTKAILVINSDGYSIDVFTEGEIKGKFTNLNRIYAVDSRSATQHLFDDVANAVINSTTVAAISHEEIVAGTKILSGIVASGLKNGAKVKAEEIRDNLVITGRFGDFYA